MAYIQQTKKLDNEHELKRKKEKTEAIEAMKMDSMEVAEKMERGNSGQGQLDNEHGLVLKPGQTEHEIALVLKLRSTLPAAGVRVHRAIFSLRSW